MKSPEQSWQFLCAGALAALLLAFISVFAVRDSAPGQSALTACLIEIVLQISFGLTCHWVIRTSAVQESLSKFIDHGSPALTTLARIAPWLVLLQIAMGAALRHKLMGAISHVAGAMLVGAYLLYFATGVMAPAPREHPARRASVLVLWIVLAQVIFGIAAYVVRFGAGQDSGLPDTRIFSIAHIITAALTLGSVYILAYLIHKSSTKQEAAGLPST